MILLNIQLVREVLYLNLIILLQLRPIVTKYHKETLS